MLNFKFWTEVTERHFELGILKTGFFQKPVFIQVHYCRSKEEQLQKAFPKHLKWYMKQMFSFLPLSTRQSNSLPLETNFLKFCNTSVFF